MTRLMDRAIEAIRALPPDTQDDIARMVLSFTGQPESPVELTPEEEGAVRRSRDAFVRGDVATDEQIQAVWAKHGL